MDPERWRRIDELLEAALERDPGERSRFLDSACAEDPSLREKVDALLAADARSRGVLDRPPELDFDSADRTGRARAGSQEAGDSIGPYRIEREIARGGMGVVYLASRSDEAFERRVAVKVLSPGRASAGLERRFRGERQILAALEHPNIARLYEGGTTAAGRPYLVMEYVDGLALDEYCDRERLDVRRRLEIFRKICAAVHYAHQRLVVHRDLKPSNILVDSAGEPRLLDFGIAKLLDPEAFPVTVEATLTGLRPMTPGYASPEQVRGEGITTASDVYSLGVLLYELLTGRPPHRFERLTPREVERVLSEEEPAKPSVAVSRPAGEGEPAPEEVSYRRDATPSQLRRRLEGDLDTIVLAALRREPARRYGSVEQLSEDVRRHLEGLPVLARQDSFGYQLATFLRRHKLAVAVAATVLMLVVAFAAAMTHQAAQIARQRDRAEQERERAEQVSAFLADVFKEADPWRRGAETITELQLLDLGAEKIERELTGQPEVRASLLRVIGDVYAHLGLYERALPMVGKALEIQEDGLGADHLDVAASLTSLASIYTRQGKHAAAERLHRRALEIRQRLLSPEDVRIAETLKNLAVLARQQSRGPEAERLARRALETARRSLGPDAPENADFLRTLAGALGNLGQHGESQRLLEEALAIDERFFGKLHTATARDLYNLGWIRVLQDDPKAAEPFFKRALSIFETVYQGDHPFVADALLGLANTVKAQDHLAEAEDNLRRALALLEKALGEEHPRVANCRYELGDSLLRQGRIEGARTQLQRSLEIRENVLGVDHPAVAESLSGLAKLHQGQGEDVRAERLYRRALGIWESHPKHPLARDVPLAYAAFLRAAGRAREAGELEARIANPAAGA